MQRAKWDTEVLAAILLGIFSLPAFTNEEIDDMLRATGTFEVKIIPQTVDNEPAQTAGVGRNAIEKQFKGDLEGISHAEMLYSGTGTDYGSYVAIEKVSGSLHGRAGSFVLVHSGVMNQGVPEHWTVRVVPGSGTDQLQGLSGTLKIIIEDGKHSYELSYTLP